MRYAIFSDIHGNLPALQAALCDAKGYSVDKYLFLGDYIRDFPWPNEVVETQLITAKEAKGALVRHVLEVAKQHGEDKMPVSNEVWKLAFETWDKDKLYLT